ncbi:MAG TPA: cytochrome c [Burkholderiales bacterium]|nr:cytochrome c [Burkholderiales bacterium]
MRKSSPLFATTLCLALVCAGAVSSASAQTLSPAAEGRRAWLKYNCYGCHGMRAQGGMGPNIAHEADDVGEAVMSGEEGGMPSFRRIVTSTDIANLRAYLRSIGTTSEPKFTHWWEPVPTK